MFEQGLVYVLKKFLSKFVEDGDAIKENVQLGVWSGLIVLENLRLKNSLLSLVDSPISLSYGYIGRLELRIPWGNLGVDPVMIIIDKVYMVIEPKYQWNPGAADKREQAMKQAKLAAAELFANKRLAATNSASQSYGDLAKNWLMTSFINKIIDNIQITVREVHVRYEDTQSCQTDFCVGFTLESLHVQSRDNSFSFEEGSSSKKDVPRSAFAVDNDNMQPELKTQGFETFHKLVQVNHASMYWNPLVSSGLNVCSCIFKGRPVSEIQAFMYRTIPTRMHQITDRPRHHYILLPVDINNYLDMSFNTSTGSAKANVKIVMSELAIQLEDLQVREIISVGINMGSFAKLQRFSEFRPTESISKDPQGWWRYAINAVLLQIRIDRKKHLSLRQISLRHRDKLVYTELWKSKLVSSAVLINQLQQVDDPLKKPLIDRENSPIYQSTYERAKRSLQAAQARESLQKGPVMTHKGTQKRRFTASLNSSKIPNGEEKDGSGGNTGANAGLFSPSRGQAVAPVVPAVPVQPLNKDTAELLRMLEYDLSFEDIVLFRSLAEKNLSLETTTQSWLGGIMSWVGAGGQAVTVTEEEKRKLFEALKYDPDRVLRGGLQEVNQNEVMSIVSVQVQQASITLSLTSPQMASAFQTAIPFLKLELEDLRNRAVIMGDGAHVSVSVSLQDFSAFEVLPSTSALSSLRNDAPRNKILFRRELRGAGPSAQQQSDWGQSSVGSRYLDTSSLNGSTSLGRSSLNRRRSEDSRPLFSVSIEILPPNKDTDMLVNLNVEELEIWVSPNAKWANAMATFVAWPADQQYWSEMEMGAMNQLADFKARFNAKIDYMMQNHQNIIIEASVKAPVVVISDQASHVEKGDVLVIDLGTITLKTEKLAKAQRQKLIDARSHTGFTSDATNTPVNRTRTDSVTDRFQGRRGDDPVAVALNFSERKLPAVPEQHNRATPDWEVLAEDENSSATSGEEQLPSSQTPNAPIVPGGALSARSLVKNSTKKNTFENSLVKANLATLEASFEQDENKSRASADEEESATTSQHDQSQSQSHRQYMAGSYGSQHAPSIGTVQTGGMEFGQDDETLFDVFQCQISQIEIYLISSAVINDPTAEDLDLSKTVIMDKFEIGIEIHASVLPWDITIPPVKLVLDIPEINVKLSEPKLIRLKQFSTELITDDSQAMISANLAKINQLNALLKRKNSDIGTQAKSRLSSRMSLLSNGSSMLNIQRRSRRTMSVGDTGSVGGDLGFFDTVSGRNSMHSNPRTSMTSRKSAMRTDKRRSRSRAGSMSQRSRAGSMSMSQRDSLETDAVPLEVRLKQLVDQSYVVGSENGDAEGANYRDPQDTNNNDFDFKEDDDDDDSFYSVNENISNEEHARQKEHLQFVISQRESIRAKLMSDIRTSEADPSKAALHDTLKKELILCEQELQQLRVAFVELLMSNEDLDLYHAEDDANAIQRFHQGLLLPVYNVDTGEKFVSTGYKRDLAQASVFKVPPTKARQQHNDTSNRELVYVRVNVNVVNVDLECTADKKLIHQITGAPEKVKKTKSSRKSEFVNDFPTPLPVVTCRLKLCGIGLKLRHRSQDSRIRLSMQALDVQDFVQLHPASALNPKPRGASVFLISSDPINFGLYALPLANRYNARGSSDLLSVKYEVLYGADTFDENGEDNLDGAQDTHNIKVAMGVVGVNIEQSRIALLLLTVHRVLQNSGIVVPPKPDTLYLPDVASSMESKSENPAPPSPVPSHASGASFYAPSPLPTPAPVPAQEENNTAPGRNSLLPNIIFQAKVDCICLSLLARAEPLLTMHVWALSSSVQSRCQAATVSLRLADFAAFYMKRRRNPQHNPSNGHPHDAHEAFSVEKISLFGRDPSSMLPFLTTSVRYEKDLEHNMVPQVIATVKTVPVLLNVDLECIGEVIREVTEGPVLEIVNMITPSGIDTATSAPSPTPSVTSKQTSAKRAPFGSVLDGAINPLVDACNGRVEIVTGAVTIQCGERPSDADLLRLNLDAKPIPKNELSVSLRTVEANLMWGDICEFGALQGTVAVQGVQLKCSGNALNDPIDVFVKSTVLPNGHFVPPNQADTVANLTFNTSFPPPEQLEVERNEVQVSMSVSPVLLHVHEAMLRSVLAWSDFVVPAAQGIQVLLQPDGMATDPCVIELAPVPHFNRTANEDTAVFRASPAPKAVDCDFNVTMCVLLYEIVVSLEVAAGGPVPSATSAAPASASKHRHSGKKHKHAPADITPLDIPLFVPIFRLVLRHFGSEIAVRPHEDGSRTPYSDNGFASMVLSVTCGLDSLDFEHIKFSGATYKRILSTGHFAEHCPGPQTPRPGKLSRCSSTSSQLLGEELMDKYVEEKDENIEFRFLNVELTLQDDFTAKVDVRVDNVHLTVIADATLALIALTDIYVTALGPEPVRGSKRKAISRGSLQDISSKPSAGLNAGGKFPSADDASNYNNYYFAHPSSVPMGPAASGTEAGQAPTTAPVAPLPLTLLNINSFSLSDLLKAITCTVSVSNCFAYVPSERRNGAGPSLCTSINLEVEVCTHDISTSQWNVLLRTLPKVHHTLSKAGRASSKLKPDAPASEEKPSSDDEITASQVFCSARCTIHSIEVFLVKSLPLEICNPVAPLTILSQDTTPVREGMSPPPSRVTRFPQMSPPRTPLRSVTSSSVFAPDTPTSQRSSATSLGGASSKDAAARFHSKTLVFPFGAEILYSAFVEVRGTNVSTAEAKRANSIVTEDIPSSRSNTFTSNDAESSELVHFVDNLRFEVVQRLTAEVQGDLEAQCFMDMRPFLRVYETSIKPVVDAVQENSEVTGGEGRSAVKAGNGSKKGKTSSKEGSGKTHADEKPHKKFSLFRGATFKPSVRLPEGLKMAQLSTLGDLLGALGQVSCFDATMRLPNMIVYVINDIYTQPVSIARMNVTGVELIVETFCPVREAKMLLLADLVQVGTVYDSDRPKEPSDPALTESALTRSMNYLTNSGSLLSPQSVRSAVKSVWNPLVPKIASFGDEDSSQDDMPSAVTWVNIRTTATIGVEYYNQRLIAREPLIEPFPLNLRFSMSQSAQEAHAPVIFVVNTRKRRSMAENKLTDVQLRDDALVAEFLTKFASDLRPEVTNERTTRQSSQAPAPAPMSVVIDIPQPIIVNMTMALTEILMVTAQTLNTVDQLAPHGKSAHPEAETDISILGIRNDSGLVMRYWTHEEMAHEVVPPNTEAPLQVEYSHDLRHGDFGGDTSRDGRYTTARYINISLHDAEHNTWPELHDVPLQGVGTRLFHVDFKQQKPSTTESSNQQQLAQHRIFAAAQDVSHVPSLALELVSKGGSKMLIVRSTIRIFNSTKATFRVELVSGYRSVRREVLWEAVVPPNQGIPVPANLCNIPNGRFVVKPVLELMARNCEGSFWPVIGPAEVSKPLAAEVALPTVPGINSAAGSSQRAGSPGPHLRHSEGGHSSDNHLSDQADEPQQPLNDHSEPNNFVHWRRELVQQRGAANMQKYSLWLSLNSVDLLAPTAAGIATDPHQASKDLCSALTATAAAVYCNVNVSSKGVPRNTQAQIRSTDSCMLRTLTFSAPVTVVNLTASAIEVAITPDISKLGHSNNLETLFKLDKSICQIVPQAALSPGESWDFLSAHAYADVSISLKFASNGSSTSSTAVTSICDVWSQALVVPGCRSRSSDTTTYTVEVPYLNGSRLSVQVEVIDRNGSRVVNVYVPYWVVTSSFLPLQYQHETWYATAADKTANGSDGLAADQTYTHVSTGNQANGAKGRPKQAGAHSKHKVPHSGLGRARGLDGVVLGPALPSRGLVDVLAPAPGLTKLLSRHTVRAKYAQQKLQAELQKPSALHNALDRYARSPSFSEDLVAFDSRTCCEVPSYRGKNGTADSKIKDFDSHKGSENKPFSLMQCGYSYKDKRTARVRLRTGITSQWSNYFSLDNPGTSSLEVASAPRDPSAEDADIARVMPHMGNARSGAGGRIFSLGVSISTAEPPFNRTQIVVLVDRYAMINTVGHPIEVRQVNHDAVFSLRNEDQVPLWWAGGSQLLQMRLARYGWSWSGKFPVNEEGEFSIRLRNEFDNTVFFVLVHVLKKGPYMYVVFRGGEKFSPYRFENHTLDTFKIKQKGQLPCTVLLPYHSSAYAWDEPLTPHFVCIDVLKNALQSQDDWGSVGTFSFDVLGPLDFKPSSGTNSQDYLFLRVVAQGPTRVLQIFDKRILRSNEKVSLSLPSTGRELVNQLSEVRNQLSSLYAASSFVPAVESESMRRAPMIVHITVHIASIGVSLVDHIPQELIYVSVSGIHVEHSLFPQENVTNLEVQRLQVDNQLWSTPYPSLLYPLHADKSFLSLVLHRDTQYTGMEFIPLLKLSVAPFDINIDGTMVMRMIDTVGYVTELLESSHVATQSRAYSQRIITATADGATFSAYNTTGNTPGRGPNAQFMFSPVVVGAEVGLSVERVAPVHGASFSYHDAADFVTNSPYSQSPRGERLRPSQVDNIHSILHTLSAQQQARQKQKQLQFRALDSPSRPGTSDSKLFGKFSKPPSDLLNARPRSSKDNLLVPKATKNVRFPIRNNRPVAPTVFPVEDQSQSTMSKYFVNKLLDSMATPRGYANPTAKVYLQKMELSEIRFNASFYPVVENGSGVTTIADETIFKSALSSVAWAILSAYLKIENAPVRFRAFKLEHVYTSGDNLGNMFFNKYVYEAAIQWYVVIFSSELIGNPLRSVYTLGEGIWDFLYLPTVGLLESPSAFVGGVFQGTKSLLRTVFASVFSTAGSLASSLQVGLIALGAVDRYPVGDTRNPAMLAITDGSSSNNDEVVEREGRSYSVVAMTDDELASESASSIAVRSRLHATTSSVQAQRPQGLFQGLQMAIAGVIFDPLTGFRVDGMKGFVFGLAKGTAGLIARPLYGTLGFASNNLDYVSFLFQPRFLANQKLRLQRVRSPRFFRSPNQPLRVYSSDENMGQDLLWRIHHGDYRREGYVWHAVLKDKTVVLMTKARILIVSNDFETGEILWNCPVKKIRSLEVDYVMPPATQEVVNTTSAALGRLSKQTASLSLTRDTSSERSSNYSNSNSNQNSDKLNSGPTGKQSLTLSSLVNFTCSLEGEPVLHIYHEPLSAAANVPATPTRAGSPRATSGRKEVAKSSGFRLAHKILLLASHRQLLEFFNFLLRLAPALASADVLRYLTTAGINVTEALKQTNGNMKHRMQRL